MFACDNCGTEIKNLKKVCPQCKNHLYNTRWQFELIGTILLGIVVTFIHFVKIFPDASPENFLKAFDYVVTYSPIVVLLLLLKTLFSFFNRKNFTIQVD